MFSVLTIGLLLIGGMGLIICSLIHNSISNNNIISKIILIAGIVMIISSFVISYISKPLTLKYGEEHIAQITTIQKDIHENNAICVTTNDVNVERNRISINDITFGDKCYMKYKTYKGSIYVTEISIDKESIEKIGIIINNEEE
jgi:hypothetical protein